MNYTDEPTGSELARYNMARQLKLETEALARGYARYTAQRQRAEAALPPAQRLMDRLLIPFANVLAQDIQRHTEGRAGREMSALKWAENVHPETLAAITVVNVLNTLPRKQPVTIQAASIEIAETIIEHLAGTIFRAQPERFYSLKRMIKQKVNSAKRVSLIRKLLTEEAYGQPIPKNEKVKLGMALVGRLLDMFPEVFIKRPMPGKPVANKRLAYRIALTREAGDTFEEMHALLATARPRHLPMVVRPKRWRSLTVGGYWKPSRYRWLVTGQPRSYMKELEGCDMTPVYRALNALQEVPYRINRRVLDTMEKAWASGGHIADLSQSQPKPLPAKDHIADWGDRRAGVEDGPNAARFRQEAAAIYEHNAKLRTQRAAIDQRIILSKRFAHEDRIWFPMTVDSRGRAYPIVAEGPRPGGNDAEKALLEFAEGRKAGPKGGYWLAVHLANTFGNDKVSFDDRVAWANSPEVVALVKRVDAAPLDNWRDWGDPDGPVSEPWRFLAACLEFAGWLRDGPDFVSHLPVVLDGSSNGLQHFSAMTRDGTGAARVNLINHAVPADIYGEVAKAAQAEVDRSESPHAQLWRNKPEWLDRKMAKLPTMTFPYSATKDAMFYQVVDRLNELAPDGEDNASMAGYLSHVLYRTVGKTVPAAAAAMRYLQGAASEASKAELMLRWKAPDGFPVCQDCREPISDRIEWTSLTGKIDRVRINVRGKAFDTKAAIRAISPNFVQSLDGAHLRSVARAAGPWGMALMVNHDSYATHADRTPLLRTILKETLWTQYRAHDVLREFHEGCLSAGMAVPGAPPAPGSFDLDAVREAEYAFA